MVRRAYAAFNRRDWEVNTLLHDRRDYVLRAGGMRRLNADAKEEYHGTDGYIEGQLQFADGWRELQVALTDTSRPLPMSSSD